MFRALLSAASIFVLLFVSLFFPGSISARSRCGERLPSTLLSLYRESDAIFVATFDKVEEGEPTESNDNFTEIPIKNHYTVSSALKGETQKLVVLEESEYRYHEPKQFIPPIDQAENANPVDSTATAEPAAPTEEAVGTEAEEAVEEEESDEPDESEIQPGDTVLLFLTKDEDSEVLSLTESIDGIKKMTSDSLAAYETRIRELKGIFSSEQPSYTELVAWMVRCAENPATRWEGTYELMRSFYSLEYEEERKATAAEKPAENPVESDGHDSAIPKDFDTGDPNFARALTESQKLILTNLLLDIKRPKETAAGNSSEDGLLARGDRELIEIVKRWGDPKVAAHLIESLRFEMADAEFNLDLMSSISSILSDKELVRIQERYSSIMWEDEDEAAEEVEAGEEAKTSNTEEVVSSAESGGDVNGERAATEQESVTVPDEEFGDGSAPPTADPVKKKTYGELRSEVIKQFLVRAEKVIAGEDEGK